MKLEGGGWGPKGWTKRGRVLVRLLVCANGDEETGGRGPESGIKRARGKRVCAKLRRSVYVDEAWVV